MSKSAQSGLHTISLPMAMSKRLRDTKRKTGAPISHQVQRALKVYFKALKEGAKDAA